MMVIRQSYVIHAPVAKVWQALTDPKVIAAWGAGPANMRPTVGYKFKLWGGDIWGKNTEIKKNKRLAQEWYTDKWKHPSLVTITLNWENGRTYVDMLQEEVPDDERDKINKGWKEFYFGPLIRLVESV